MGTFKPVVLISPRGNEYVARDAREYNNLVGQSYRVKNVVEKATPEVIPVVAADPVAIPDLPLISALRAAKSEDKPVKAPVSPTK